MQDLSKRLKHAESVNGDLARRVDELERDNSGLNSENSRLNAELAKLRIIANELQDRNDNLGRENKQLSGTYLCIFAY